MTVVRAVFMVAGLCLTSPLHAAQGDLAGCAAQFRGNSTDNAPRAAQPAASNVHICARSGEASFFALEYSPQRYAPAWVSYRIADTFGAGGCASLSRQRMRCHFTAENIEACIKNKKGADPFHQDIILSERQVRRLGIEEFFGTGHDRGHMAPNNALSWHACGAYKTFTMANMSAQWASLNQRLWANLEAQMLFWGVNGGPIIVTVGPLWRRFPSEKFKAIENGIVKTDTIPAPGELLKKIGGDQLAKKIPRPTGFYMIGFRPGQGGEPDRSIAFLVPHTKQQNLSAWNFLATITLVEETSGLRFGFADDLKKWPDLAWWRAADRQPPEGWDIRRGCNEALPVPGWNADLPLYERLAICRSADPVH